MPERGTKVLGGVRGRLGGNRLQVRQLCQAELDAAALIPKDGHAASEKCTEERIDDALGRRVADESLRRGLDRPRAGVLLEDNDPIGDIETVHRVQVIIDAVVHGVTENAVTVSTATEQKHP